MRAWVEVEARAYGICDFLGFLGFLFFFLGGFLKCKGFFQTGEPVMKSKHCIMSLDYCYLISSIVTLMQIWCNTKFVKQEKSVSLNHEWSLSEILLRFPMSLWASKRSQTEWRTLRKWLWWAIVGSTKISAPVWELCNF